MKLMEWFGKAMFVDLYVRGLLPTKITPRQLLEPLSTTYAQGRDIRAHMEQVERERVQEPI